MKNSEKNLLDSLNSQAKKEGSYLVSRLQKSRYKYLEVLDDKVEEIRSGRHSGIGLHLFDSEGHSYLASTDKINNPNHVSTLLQKAQKELKEISKNTTKNPEIFKLNKYNKNTDLSKNFDYNKFSVTQLEKKLLNLHKEIKKLTNNLNITPRVSIDTYFSVRENYWRITRTDGTDVSWAIPSCRLQSIIHYSGESNKVLDRISNATLGWNAISKKDQVNKFLKNVKSALEMLKVSADQPQYPAGNYNLLIDATLGGLLAHEAFGHAAESDIIYAKDSVLGKKGNLDKGKKVANKIVSIYDDSKDSVWGYTPFSAFGIPRKKMEIVKQGILRSSIGDTFSGNLIGDKNSGGSRVQSYENVPVPRMCGTYISVQEPFPKIKETSPQEIQKLLQEKNLLKNKVLLLKHSTGGGQVDPNSGTFMFSFAYLYEITPNKIRVFRGSSFSGNILRALKSTIAGFGPVQQSLFGKCGKSGQNISIAAGSNQFLYMRKTPAVTLGGNQK